MIIKLLFLFFVSQSVSSFYINDPRTQQKVLLTWSIFQYDNDLSVTELWRNVNTALNVWSKFTRFEFKYVQPNQNPNIKISFVRNMRHQTSNGYLCWFGDPNVLGHAFFPDSYLHGEIHIINFDTNQISFQKLFLHELGHYFGLEHNNRLTSIMYPSISKGKPLYLFDNEDLNVLRQI